jgi:hypothetical protein
VVTNRPRRHGALATRPLRTRPGELPPRAACSSNGGPRAVALPSRLQGPFKFPLSHQRRFPAGGKRAQPTPRLGASRRERPPDNTALRRWLAPRCAHIDAYAASPGGARRLPGARTSSAAAALRLWVRSLGRSVGTRALPAAAAPSSHGPDLGRVAADLTLPSGHGQAACQSPLNGR